MNTIFGWTIRKTAFAIVPNVGDTAAPIRILKGLKRYDSKAKLCFLSYVDSLSVPTIAPDKDMFLEFAPIGRNHAVPMDGNDEANIKNRKVLESMLKIFPPENTEILEYFLDVSLL